MRRVLWILPEKTWWFSSASFLLPACVGTWRWWTQWWLYEKGTQIRKSELFPLQFGLAYYNKLLVLCSFLRVRFCVKKRLVGEGTRNTTQRSLMFPGKLAHKYIMNFILFMCISYLLLWKGKVISSFSTVFFNMDDRYADDKAGFCCSFL